MTWINSKNLRSILKSYSKPVYVYKKSIILSQLSRLQKAFGAETRIHFAMKSNSNLNVLSLLAKNGTQVDVVSYGEIERALRAGFKPSDVLFAGIGKSKEEIEGALRKNIFMFNVESKAELARIGQLARKLKKKARVSLRLNPDVSTKTHPYIATGFRKNKFGIDLASLGGVTEILNVYSDSLELKGIGFHIGSQIMDKASYLDAIKKTIPVYKDLKGRGYNLEYFDLGGGFGVDYKNKKHFDLSRYARQARHLLKGFNCTIIIEPGRFLTAEAGCLLTQVEYVKRTPYKTFVIVDTGMHHLLRPSLYDAYHEIIPIKKRAGKFQIVDVVGPICESSDFIAQKRRLSPVKEGDFLAISHAGAYGFVMASHYNLKGLPQETVIP